MTPNVQAKSIGRDERAIRLGDRVFGVLGPLASTFTLAWLASHRDRLWTLLLGGHRLSVLIVWDAAGRKDAARSQEDVEAVYQLVYGEPWPEGTDDAS